MRTASKIVLCLLTPFALACGERGEKPCQSAVPASFDFVIFDAKGKNYAENIPPVFTYSFLTKEKNAYVKLNVLPGPRTPFLSSPDIPRKSLDGEKTFILAWGLEAKPDTLFVDLENRPDCLPARYRAVRLNGKNATFEYGIGPNGAFVFRK